MTGGVGAVDPVVVRTWDTPPGVSTAGSRCAVAPELRLAAARLLHEQGRWVHVDVITVDGRPTGGVAAEELAVARAALPDALVEVHLIQRDGGQAHLDAVVGQLLATGPQRVILRCTCAAAATRYCAGCEAAARRRGSRPLRTPGGRRPRRAGSRRWCPRDAHPPGTRENADLARLETVQLLAAQSPVGVHGGVGPQNTAACLTAGAVHLISGRALLRRGAPTPSAQEGAR